MELLRHLNTRLTFFVFLAVSILVPSLVFSAAVPLISFVPPTPTDGSYVNTDSVTVNVSLVITDGTTISSCILKWDGAELTMTQKGSGSSISCIYTQQNLDDGSYEYKVNVTESGNGGSNETSLRSVNVDTVFPLISFVSPTPANNTNSTTTRPDIRVNVTDNNTKEVLLDFGGTNYTLNCGSGNSFYCTSSERFSSGTYIYFVYVSDKAGNSNKTKKRTIFINASDWDIESSPADGAVNVSLDFIIGIDFNRAMNRDSAQEAFSISPSLNHSFSWQGGTLVVRHSAFTPATTYNVEIDEEAEDSVGNLLGEDFEFSFTTTFSRPRVTSTTPANGATGVIPNTQITIVFSNTMNRTTVRQAFSITPSVQGSFSWPEDSKVVFTPSAPLKEETTYVVQLTIVARDISDISLLPHTFSFTTAGREITSPTLISTSPNNNEVEISIDTDIKIRFSKAMDKASVEQGFSISPDVTGSFSWLGNTFVFTPENPLEPDASYTVSVLNVKDAQGLSIEDIEFSFTTAEEGKSYWILIPLVIFNVFVIILVIWLIVKARRGREEVF